MVSLCVVGLVRRLNFLFALRKTVHAAHTLAHTLLHFISIVIVSLAADFNFVFLFFSFTSYIFFLSFAGH